tara:strand:+ start:19 stop:693 length:675 start_codon:yes stop_codon:yes gene_type:complete
MHQLIDKKNKVIFYLLLIFILSTTSGKFEDNQKRYPLLINQINIKGLSNSNNSKIFNQLDNLFYENILLIGREEVQRVIDRYNIIEEYSIKKIYPSTINITIKPTKFIARLSINDQLVGGNGKLIEDKENEEILPYIFGQFNTQEFLNFKKNIEQSEFTFAKFKTLYFFPSKRWDILTNENILIKLSKDNLLESLDLAHKVINNSDFKDMALIDLRMNNHLIIK